jgi:transcriptional regulator with XRE-family HTH domain
VTAAQSEGLARRLRELRAGARLTQPLLGAVFGVRAPSVSAWESTGAPPESRLSDYATFFATPRSLDGRQPRLLTVAELTDDERAARDQLLTELLELREQDLTAVVRAELVPTSTWHFPDGKPIRLICGQLDREDRPKFASGGQPNYMKLSAYADLDALVELFGHIRSLNPSSDVGFDLGDRLEDADYHSHLIVLGGYGAATAIGSGTLEQTDIPVRQIEVDDWEHAMEGKRFEVDGRRYGAEFDATTGQFEDVGLFARIPSPYDSTTTLTVCSGVFTRGVYGSVRFLTDAGVRDRNEKYLAEHFADADSYALLMRVKGQSHATASPDLYVKDTVLLEWPPPDRDS